MKRWVICQSLYVHISVTNDYLLLKSTVFRTESEFWCLEAHHCVSFAAGRLWYDGINLFSQSHSSHWAMERRSLLFFTLLRKNYSVGSFYYVNWGKSEKCSCVPRTQDLLEQSGEQRGILLLSHFDRSSCIWTAAVKCVSVSVQV